MKEIFRSIGILIALIALGSFVPMIPDFADGAWTNFGAAGGSLFAILFGLIPIILFILLDTGVIDVYSLPFSDILDEGVKYLLYISVLITSLTCSVFTSALTNAISLVLTLFVVLFPIYLLYDEIVRMKIRVKNEFLSSRLVPLVFGGAIVLPIALAYLLALAGVYLPGDIFLSLGVESYFGDLVTLPALYFYSIIATLAFIVYSTVICRIIGMFKPKTKYKYATYGDEYRVCKNCRFYRGGRCELGFTDRTIGSNGVICYDYKRRD